MKRVWIAVGVFVILIGLCIGEFFVTSNMTIRLTDTLFSAQKAVEDGDMGKASKITEELGKSWDSDHKILSMFIQHQRLEQIDQSFAVMDANLKAQQLEDYLAEVNRALAQLDHLQDTEMPTAENIL